MLVSVVFVVGFVLLASLSLSGSALTAPAWVTRALEARINNGLPAGELSLGRLVLQVDDRGIPAFSLQNVGVFDDRGVEIARLNDVSGGVSPAELLHGRFSPDGLRLSGAQVTILRLADGQFDLSFGAGTHTTGTFVDVLDSLDAAFALDTLHSLERLEAGALTITLEDVRSGRRWQITEGRLSLSRLATGLEISVAFDVFNGTEELAETTIGISTNRYSSAATLGTTFRNAAAADIALQTPALSFLGVLNTQISGSVRAEFGEDGTLGLLAGTLEMAKGALQPNPAIAPVGFDAAKTYFRFDPKDNRLRFTDISVQSEAGTLSASGQAYLQDFQDRWPSTLVGQLQLSEFVAHPLDLYDEPVRFSSGAADLRVRLNPFSVEVGQFVLSEGDEKLLAKGEAHARPDGWELSADLSVNTMQRDRILALWPTRLATKTRDWVVKNIDGGMVSDVKGALRLAPEAQMRNTLGFRFNGSDARFINTMPEITGAAGYGVFDGKRFVLALEKGSVLAKTGGRIDLAGSVMEVPDITERPSWTQISLEGRSTIEAALSLMNEPPFRILRGTEFSPDMANGAFRFNADIGFRSRPKVDVKDVNYDVVGEILNATSTRLVPGRIARGDRLLLLADPAGVEISGRAMLGSAEGDILWRQDIGPDAAGRSRLTGNVLLSRGFSKEFHLGLPEESLVGAADGNLTVDFVRGKAPRFSLESDLKRLAIDFAPLGWSKSAEAGGRLVARGQLGDAPGLNFLEVFAPGLTATGGTVSLQEDGGLDELRFENLSVGGWFDAPVRLVGRGPDQTPRVVVEGGTLDVRNTTFGSGGTGPSTRQIDGLPITLEMEKVTISSGIALSNFSAQLDTSGGISGVFNGRVNGGARVVGRLTPDSNGTAVRIQSEDAGGVLDSAGILTNASGGLMDVTLRPQPTSGVYNGKLLVSDTRVTKAPALAELLSAISIVGLIDQMNGPGISFTEVEADFQLTPDRVYLLRSSAIGPALGVTLDGVYNLVTGRMNMQGVVSPVYFLNAVGQVVSRRGEGLFGFNFEMKGTKEDLKVKVNPLSILTPGIFRDIFRRPPPTPVPSE